jgi:hypothetical protein
MDFFERYLRISPDGGSGATEVGCVLAVAILLLLLFYRSELQCACRACINVFSPKLRSLFNKYLSTASR